ncbi:RCC1 domain-containing protein, partial [Pyxidicoccus fallax]
MRKDMNAGARALWGLLLGALLMAGCGREPGPEGADDARERLSRRVQRLVPQGAPRRLAAGAQHSLHVAADGTAWAWGGNGVGQLGLGDFSHQHLAPTRVPELTDVVGVAAGDRHSLALRADGTVWAWGGNANGQLGDGTWTDRASPARLEGLT